MFDYIIRAQIQRVRDRAFIVKAEATSKDAGAPEIEKRQPCDPCTYAEARTTCYKFVAELGHAIAGKGGRVADVQIIDVD